MVGAVRSLGLPPMPQTSAGALPSVGAQWAAVGVASALLRVVAFGLHGVESGSSDSNPHGLHELAWGCRTGPWSWYLLGLAWVLVHFCAFCCFNTPFPLQGTRYPFKQGIQCSITP